MKLHPRHAVTNAGTWLARPWAFMIVAVYTVAWAFFDAKTLDWEAVATLATWMMTLFIQRSEHRDTQAIHAKLDELLRANGLSSSRLTNIDDEEPEEIEGHRADARKTDQATGGSDGM